MRGKWAVWLALGAAGFGGAALLPAPRPGKPPQQKLSFSRDVMPILSDKCFKCHGPDPETRMANLRLDSAESVFANRDGHFDILPGHPERSRLIARITLHEMPPADSGKSLSPEEIATLTRWVAQGAPYGKLWSFEPLPARIAPPKVASDWPHDDLDRFVLARLREHAIRPSAPASRDRWLRRVTYDLIGLPPTEPEIAAFAADVKPGAFDRVVDRLLASPHYGERLAVDWLDAARYSDSYGYQSDLLSPNWPYRDWVIRAFNANLPYDRFVVDQLAGDLLPNATRDERLATAFCRLHRQSNEGGSIPLEFKTEYAADRVATYGSAMLGLTLGCARCHDHKFDPITQREYYQLFAYFNSIPESGLIISTDIVPSPTMLLPTPEQDRKLAELRLASAAAIRAYDDSVNIQDRPPTPTLAHFTFDKIVEGKYPNQLATPASATAFATKIGKVETVPGPDRKPNAVQLDGDNGIRMHGLPGAERWDAFSWMFSIKDARTSKGPVVLLHRTGGTDTGFCGFDLMLEGGYLTARVMRHWPGNGVGVRSLRPIPANQWTRIGWTWDGFGRAAGLRIFIDGQRAETNVLNDQLWKKIHDAGDLGDSGGDWTFGNRFRDAGFRGDIADVSFTDGVNDGKAPALNVAARKAQENLANYEEGIPEIAVMQETPSPLPGYLLARGNYDAPRTPQTLVRREVPKCFPPLYAARGERPENNRLALAAWTVRSDNPLAARVAVNRIWQMLFGVGIVETSENLGAQGSRPANRELLDYLPRQFIDSGWNVKALVRRIVLSATYRQDSALTKELRAKDPENRLFARGPSHRLSAEMIRDTALAAGGLLDLRLGGPPVNPYQPAGIWSENNTMSPQFVQSKGADLYRRSIYSTWKRTTPVPSMLLFDAPSREACVIRRQATNTPLQALVLLNDVQFVEASRRLAEHVLGGPGEDETRLRTAFLRLAARQPDKRELAILTLTLGDQRKQFHADPPAAAKLIAIGDSKADAKLDPIELAAMTATVQVIMNSDCMVWER
jgi:hypothetical protein